ncbi:hypothetical protein PoB_007477800 [Plakobranchus ocellatus]|uniref:Uncharacterized protein n=1 Tax=Plakobranchus ocellatus TaxID=259542 RepID=A0AAV4DVJ1_9GAST|nr:hypothetical protein PoB_007477800 [Plakobranchus ocellatus]
MHLYSSVEWTVLNAETVFQALMQELHKDCKPLENIVSILADSAAYMAGRINGFLAKIKEIAPDIVDIRGDLCYYVHNTVDVSADIIYPLPGPVGPIDDFLLCLVDRRGEESIWIHFYSSSHRSTETESSANLGYDISSEEKGAHSMGKTEKA